MLVLTGGKEVFVFDFGAVVFWGFKHGEEEEMLEQIRYHVVKDWWVRLSCDKEALHLSQISVYLLICQCKYISYFVWIVISNWSFSNVSSRISMDYWKKQYNLGEDYGKIYH